MKRTDMYKVFAVISVYYPSATWAASASESMIDAWMEMLAPYPFEVVSAALKRHVVNSTYEPRIADLLTEMKMLEPVESRTEMTAEQAWALVLMAVKNSSYHAKREFEKLPADIKRRIGSAGVLQYWATVDDDGATLSVARANFLRSYGEDLKGRKMESYMPDSVKKLQQTETEQVKQLTEQTESKQEESPVSNIVSDESKAQQFFELAKKIANKEIK